MEHSNCKARNDRVLQQALAHHSQAYRQLHAAWAAGAVPRSRRESHLQIMEWAREEIRLLAEELDRRSSPSALKARRTEFAS